jgi:acetyltransferase
MKAFFEPSSIAVIGASSDPKKVGGMVLRNIIASGYKGKIFPVNVKGGTICGLDAVTAVDGIDGTPELAVIAVRSDLAVNEMEKIGKKGVKAAVVITAGFKEESCEGRELEKRLKETAERFGVRTVGPNCFGLMNTHAGLNATFSSLFPPAGGISLCSQSGAVGATMLDWSIQTNNGISKFVSLGNKMDMDEADAVEYFGSDKETTVIGIYSEGISNGGRFIEAVSRTGKPVVMLKSGRSSAGSMAASSHTGALSGSDAVYDAVFERLNIIRVKDLDALFDALSVISSSKRMTAEGVAVVTNAGGLGVMAADACSDNYGLSLASLSPETEDRIRDEVPSAASTHNPVDVRGDATNEMITKALETVAGDDGVGGIVVLSSPLDMTDLTSIATAVAGIKAHLDKPVTVSFAGGTECEKALSVLRRNGVPSYPSPDRAVRALSYLRMALTERNTFEPIELPGMSGRHIVSGLLETAKREHRSALSEEEGKAILSSYGIPVPPEFTARNAREAVDAAERIGYPVVMKILSADILHKTDIGGVMLNIKDCTAVRDAFELLISRCTTAVPGAKVDGVSVQKMVSGREMIVSMVRDDQFGPVLAFGSGGIYVEIMGEISRSLIPMSEEDMDKIIMSTKAYRMLSGARGRPPADIGSLKDIMKRMMKIATENPEIYELEINPVMVGPEGSWAVDALTTVR